MDTVEIKKLRSSAHALKPVVMIGQNGLSESVFNEINLALDTHELIKIKIQSDDRTLRKSLSNEICSQCNAELIQSIGKIIVIFRENPDK